MINKEAAIETSRINNSDIDSVKFVENAIDDEFKINPLLNINYAQAVWTLLSVLEDNFLKNITFLPISSIGAYVDKMLNVISLPIRSSYQLNPNRYSTKINQEYIDQHYGWGFDWINKAINYDSFYTIFPLWHNEKLQLYVEGNYLNTSDWRNRKFEYEAYNRIIQEPNRLNLQDINYEYMLEQIMANVNLSETKFKINYKPKLAKLLIDNYISLVKDIYELPEKWQTSKFEYGEFRKVFISIQALLLARFIVRSKLANEGMKGLGYSSAVWVVSYSELLSRIVRYSNVTKKRVQSILNYLTFGSNGIRTPDVAIQPLIDLENGFYALSPFIWINSNAERNFCVLLNMIEKEKKIYSALVNEKEDVFRKEVIKIATSLGYETEYGELDNTDLDIAIIDRSEKICVCIELKWFISPAEIREVCNKSVELDIGVKQAKVILELFKKNDLRLNNLLKIDESYKFSVYVGSKNWIGFDDVQDIDIPIINMAKFLDKLNEFRSLKKVVNWFDEREFLPKEKIDYEIEPFSLEFGKWHSSWYGLKVKVR